MPVKPHPIVKKYLNNNTYIFELLDEYQNDPDPIIQAMHEISQAMMEKGEGKKAKKVIRKYQDLDLSNSEVNIVLMFILYLSKILRSKGHNEKNKALLNFANSLLSPTIHPELKLLINYETAKEFKSINDNFNFNLKTLPKLISTSFKAKNLLGAHAVIISRSGLLKEIKKNTLSQLNKNHILSSSFYDAVERFELKEAEKYLIKIKKLIPKYDPMVFVKYERWQYLLQIFSNSFQLINDYAILDKEHTCLINANYFLSLGDSEQASEWMKKVPIKVDFESSSFLSFTYIRIALTKGFLKTARSLLKQKTDVYKHYFDDFYYMRIQLLLGDLNTALIYFARLLKNCRKYHSEKMLAYELKLSREINAGDLWHLSQMVNKVTSKEIETLETYIPDNHTNSKGTKRILGKSQKILSVISKIKQFAKTKSHILITGETGVGKDLVAKALHELSNQRTQPYLAINCGAISESILQSELFGHEAGAYTSADKKHIGIFESAGEGTVFLDEIGETSPRIQVALLRVLENNEGRALGSAKVKKYSCRILAATNAKLKQQVDLGKFREDLYFRLKSLEIEIPPLRERAEDIEILIQYFFNLDQPDGSQPELSNQLMREFKNFDWPGNVRELKNEVQKIRIMNAEKDYYTIDDTDLFKDNYLNNQPRFLEGQHKGLSNVKTTEDELILVVNKNSKQYRVKKIKMLFQKHKRLARQELANTTKSSYKTIGTDLKELIQENFIEKIEPTASPRTHYFILKEPQTPDNTH